MQSLKYLSVRGKFALLAGLLVSSLFLNCSKSLALNSADGNLDLGAPSASTEKRFLKAENKRITSTIRSEVKRWSVQADTLYQEVERQRDQAQIQIMWQVVGEINQFVSAFTNESPLSTVGANFQGTQILPALAAAISQQYPTSAASFPGLDNFIQVAGLSGQFADRAQVFAEPYKSDLLSLPMGGAIDYNATHAQVSGLISKYQGKESETQLAIVENGIQIVSTEQQISQTTSQIRTSEAGLEQAQESLAHKHILLNSLLSALSSAQSQLPPDQALIAALQTQIAGLNSEIAALQAEISARNVELGDLQSQLSNLNSSLSDLQNQRELMTKVDLPLINGAIGQFSGMKTLLETSGSLISADIPGKINNLNIDYGLINNISGSFQGAFNGFTDNFSGAQNYLNGLQDQFARFQSSQIFQLAKQFGPMILQIIRQGVSTLIQRFVQGIAGQLIGVVKDAVAGILPGWVRGLIPGLAISTPQYLSASASTTLQDYAPKCRASMSSTARGKCEKKRAAKWRKFKAGYSRFRKQTVSMLPSLLLEASRDPQSGETITQFVARSSEELRIYGIRGR